MCESFGIDDSDRKGFIYGTLEIPFQDEAWDDSLTTWLNNNWNAVNNKLSEMKIQISEQQFNELLERQVSCNILKKENGGYSVNKKYQPEFSEVGVSEDDQDDDDDADETDDPEENDESVSSGDNAIKKLHNIARNRIIFGAPGTGKSYKINGEYNDGSWSSKERVTLERVTFHPDYSYANFVGAYKPYMAEDGKITYSFVPGPFTRVLVNALRDKDPNGKHLLVIEEINRANTAAVFGDVFQLLDRGENGKSEYAISPSQDLAKFLREALVHDKTQDVDGSDDDWWWLAGKPVAEKKEEVMGKICELRIPSNMYLWATMNSADQGVFPMDTAFKRRWSFEYVGIDEGEDNIAGDKTLVPKWNKLRKAINNKLVELKVNEDKCMGPFFLAEDNLKDVDAFLKAFKSKVLMYLFEDAARQKRSNVFADRLNTLSSIFNAVNNKQAVFKESDPEEALKKILDLKKDGQDKTTTEEQAQAGGGESAQQESQGYA